MSKAYLGAFIAIATLAVGAVDYLNQAKTAGSAPGKFGVGDYVGSISERFVGQKQAVMAAAERQSLISSDPRDLLPEAPEGWTRHDWDAKSADLLGRRYDMQKDDFLPDEIKQDPTMAALAALDTAAGAHKDAREVFVYEKPGAVVALRLSIMKSGGGGIAGAALQMVANNMEALSSKSGFAIVKGVTFRLERGMLGMSADDADYRVITGQIGREVKISLRARAGDSDIVDLLGGIDYDRLNKVLETPVAEIGSAAKAIPPEQQRAEAERRVEEAAAKQRVEAIEGQYRMQMAALDMMHRLGKVSDEQYEKARAKLEGMHDRIGDIAAASSAQTDTRTAAIPAPAPDATEPAEPSFTGGGIVGSILGSLGFGKAEPALTTNTPIQPASANKIKVNVFSAGTCKQSGLGKRCTVGD